MSEFIMVFAGRGAEGGEMGTRTAGRARGAGAQAHGDELRVPRAGQRDAGESRR